MFYLRFFSRFIPALLMVLTTEYLIAAPQCTMCHALNQSQFGHPIASAEHDIRGTTGPNCTSCHGESLSHMGDPSKVSPDKPFNAAQFAEAENWNDQCLGCHKKSARHWTASEHALEGMTCNACHTIHDLQDTSSKGSQPTNTCGNCHQQVRSDFLLPSRHPVNESEMGCTDCHNPHGSLTSGQLSSISVNATCLACHEAQRGPFLFDHPPASEDCLGCHKPHGAVHKPLLKTRGPQLCQQCHMANFHPSNLEAGGGLPGRRPSAALLGKNCMNCHPKVHGSNHPSGARLTR